MGEYTSVNKIMDELLEHPEIITFSIIKNKRNQRYDEFLYYVGAQQALIKRSQQNYQSYIEGEITQSEYDFEDQKNKLLQFICSVQLEIIAYEREIKHIEKEQKKLQAEPLDDDTQEHINYLVQQIEMKKITIHEKVLEIEALKSKFYGLQDDTTKQIDMN